MLMGLKSNLWISQTTRWLIGWPESQLYLVEIVIRTKQTLRKCHLWLISFLIKFRTIFICALKHINLLAKYYTSHWGCSINFKFRTAIRYRSHPPLLENRFILPLSFLNWKTAIEIKKKLLSNEKSKHKTLGLRIKINYYHLSF